MSSPWDDPEFRKLNEGTIGDNYVTGQFDNDPPGTVRKIGWSFPDNDTPEEKAQKLLEKKMGELNGGENQYKPKEHKSKLKYGFEKPDPEEGLKLSNTPDDGGLTDLFDKYGSKNDGTQDVMSNIGMGALQKQQQQNEMRGLSKFGYGG